MDTKLVIVEKAEDNKVVIDKQELLDLLEERYEEGFKDGKASVCTALKISEEPQVFTTEYDIVKTCKVIDDMLADIRNGSQ